MSCFEVGSTHIDALLTAGLNVGRYGPLRWYVPSDDTEGDYEQGEPWGPEAIKHYQQRRRELTEETAGMVGAMLVAENRRSVDYRYDEAEEEEPYVFNALQGRPDPVVVLKAIACYEYQACETPDWEESEAYAFCQALRHRMIGALPGYDDADGWEVSDRRVFLKQVGVVH